MISGKPKRNRQSLPAWLDETVEPEQPTVSIYYNTDNAPEIRLTFTDEVTAEWMAHWFITRADDHLGFWHAFTFWLDHKRLSENLNE